VASARGARAIPCPRGRDRPEAVDSRRCRIVEYRFFGGLTIRETADVLGISPATVKREWVVARAWLNRELEASA
jgi:DNA-binding CsgD family transcriptional regulator